jgi:hypothetical protein
LKSSDKEPSSLVGVNELEPNLTKASTPPTLKVAIDTTDLCAKRDSVVSTSSKASSSHSSGESSHAEDIFDSIIDSYSQSHILNTSEKCEQNDVHDNDKSNDV